MRQSASAISQHPQSNRTAAPGLQNTPLLEYDRPQSPMAAAEAAQSYSSVAFGCWQLGNKASTGDYWGTEYTDDMAIKMVNPRLSARCLVLTS
jgi:hypothetical protein